MPIEPVHLPERFKLEAAVASGGMGAVYRAIDGKTGEPVAVKILHRGFDDGGRFEREAVLLAALGHTAIVRYVAHGLCEDGRPYLAMEWLVGEDLGKRLTRGPLTVPETLALAARVSEGLAAVHRAGLVHRDLKPDNIFLCGGEIANAKLIDFGLVRPPRSRALTAEGQIVGTPAYMAPEQIRGETLDPRVDVYALGAVLYECLSQRRAFTGPNQIALLTKVLVEPPAPLSDLCPELPNKLADLVHSMLAKDPRARPADAQAVHAEITDLYRAGLEGRPARVSRPSIALDHRRASAALVVRMRSLERDRTLPAFGPIAAMFGARVLAKRPDGALMVIEGGRAPEDQVVTATRLGLDVCRSPGIVAYLALVHDVEDNAATLFARVKALAPSLPDGVVVLDPLAESLLPSRFDRSDAPSGGEPGMAALCFVSKERDGLDLPRPVLGRVTPFAGRHAELSRVVAATLLAFRTTRAGLVTLSGESGTGVSRLRQEALLSLRDVTPPLGVRILAASGDPRHKDVPLGPFAAMFRGLFALTGRPDEDRRRVLTRVAQRVAAAEVPLVARFLGELLNVRFAESDPMLFAARSDRSLMSEQVRAAVTTFVRAEAASGPLLLVLENVHDVDDASLALCARLLSELAEAPFVLWCVGRPSNGDRLASLSARVSERVSLLPLPLDAARALVRSVVGAAAPDLVVEEILDGAAGAPLLLEEAARAWMLGAHGKETAPWDAGLRSMFEARLASLEPELGRVLRAASLMGSAFWVSALCELLPDQTSSQIHAAVQELVRREWLVEHSFCRFPGEREFSFRSEAVREASAGLLDDADQAQGHELVARWLLRHGESNARLLAEHFEAAGMHAVAGIHFLAAADRALSFEDVASARALTERALAQGADAETRGGLFAVQAEALRKAGAFQAGYDAAASALAELEPLGSPRSRRWFDAAGEAVTLASRLRKLSDLAAWGDRLLAETRDRELEPSSAQIIATARAATLLDHAGVAVRAEPLHEWLERVAASRELEPLARGRVDFARAWRALGRGDYDAYRRSLLEALASFERAGDQRTAAQLEANAAHASLELGEYDEAVRLSRAALARAAVARLPGGLAVAQNNLGFALGLLGQLDEGLRVEREAVAAYQALGDTRLEGACRVYLAELLALRGRPGEAHAEALRAVELLSSIPLLLPFALVAQSAAEVALGAVGDAVVTARRAVSVMEAAGRTEGNPVRVWLRLALALEAAKEIEGARVAATAAAAALDEAANKLENPLARARFREQVRAHRELFALQARLEIE